jgi:hypothetical protein
MIETNTTPDSLWGYDVYVYTSEWCYKNGKILSNSGFDTERKAINDAKRSINLWFEQENLKTPVSVSYYNVSSPVVEEQTQVVE